VSAEILEALVRITTSIFEAADRRALFQALESGCSALGFDVFALSCRQPPGPELILNAALTTASSNFLHDYEHFNWFESDVSTQRTIAGEGPFYWDSLQDRYADVRKQSYIDFLHSIRMCTGLMVPLLRRPRAVSAMGLVAFSNRSFGRATTHAATIMANAAMAKAEMLGLCREVSADEAIAVRSLSPPQVEILKWIAEGKSNADIATITSLKERAVRYHVAEILRKLGVATRTQAAGVMRSSLSRP